MEVDDVERVAVLGAGSVGRGVAETTALAGRPVTLRDLSADLVAEGYDRIEWSLDGLVEKGHLSAAEAEAALDRVTTAVDLSTAVADADVVVEAVPERPAVKRDVFASASEAAPDRAVFVTTTDGLSITALSDHTDRPERFCGMHFFDPPVRTPVVEVVAGAHTIEETLSLAVEFAETLGKTPVRLDTDSPGYVVNRVLAPTLNEAAWAVHDGDATVAEVDSTVRYDLGFRLGAFERAERMGVGGVHAVLDSMRERLGEGYEPCPLFTERTEEGVDDAEATASPDRTRADLRRRLVATMADEVAALQAEGVADAATVDEAVKLATGVPEGPAALADESGLDELVETLDERRAATEAARYAVTDRLRELAARGEALSGTDGATSVETTDAAVRADADGGAPDDDGAVRVEREGDVARVVLDRPHRMNTIDERMLADLDAAIDEVMDAEVRAVLLTGAGDRAFSVGADVQRLAGAESAQSAGVDLARRGQTVFRRLERCDVPVVAAIDGYCLGGGLELACCADLRVASSRSEFGQPEHNLGLSPGWGATQRLPRLVGESRAKELLFTADRYDAETMAAYGLLLDVTAAAELDDRATELARDLAAGPPEAHRVTKRAIHRGRGDFDAGLEAEAEGFGRLVDTEDFREGVDAFMSDRDPRVRGTIADEDGGIYQ